MLEKFSEEEIDKLCFMRGIEINTQNLKKKKEDLKLWLSISNQRNVPHSLLLYTRINDFTNDMFEIDEDEDEQEILRRVSNIILIIFIHFSYPLTLIILKK